MRLLRAATLTAADLGRTERAYAETFDYRVVERGTVSEALAAAWGASATAGAPLLTMGPASGTGVFLRFVEGAPTPGYAPLTTYGWAAIELCVTDVLAVNARIPASPFTVIGPPRELDGMPAIYPMQVEGPDREIVYLTQIRDDLPSYDLPRAQSLIDHLFILVLACSDMRGALGWMERELGLGFGREITLVYTMLAKAFGVPETETFTIATLTHGRDVFLEADQYPPQARPRPAPPGGLAPGVGIGTLWLPDFEARLEALRRWAIAPPAAHAGPIYAGKPAMTLRGPDGTLFEVVAG